MQIRPNLAKRRLEAGQPVIAPNMGPNSVPDLETLELLASQALFDAAWIEMEHGPYTWADLANVSRVCDLWGVTSLVRVNRNDPALIGRALDRGVQGVLVPHVNTAEEAARAVRGARYAPLGARGFFLSRQSFGVDRYLDHANDEILVIVLVEEVEAIRNLDEIVEVEGIDCVFVAPSDLAQSMGPQYLGRRQDPDVQEVVKKSIARIVKAGKAAGTIVDDHSLPMFFDLGVRFMRVHAMGYLQDGLRNFRMSAESLNGE